MNSSLRAAIGLWYWIALAAVPLAAAGPAHFEHGQDVPVATAHVRPQGATLNTGTTGTPVDGITVEIPADAVEQETTVTLAYNTGTLSLPRGEGSGVFLRLTAAGIGEFRQPVSIHVRYDAQRHRNAVVVGYAIDAKGRLRAVDTEALDSPAGTVTFSTFVPLLLTWVYSPVP